MTEQIDVTEQIDGKERAPTPREKARALIILTAAASAAIGVGMWYMAGALTDVMNARSVSAVPDFIIGFVVSVAGLWLAWFAWCCSQELMALIDDLSADPRAAPEERAAQIPAQDYLDVSGGWTPERGEV